ncbi:MAG: hypothetical protein ACO3JJ_11070 [Opitutaceae bacterium]
MNPVLVAFWGLLLAASLVWYGFLVFHVGGKAGREIRDLTATLGAEDRPPPPGR